MEGQGDFILEFNTKILSKIETAPRCTLFTLFTLLTWFTFLTWYTLSTWLTELPLKSLWRGWMDGTDASYPLESYDPLSANCLY